MSEEGPQPVPESGRVYRTVTRYWPRIAAGLVGLAAISELVVGGLTANGALEFYVFTWATTTGGLWFLFEKAEKALSDESRETVVGWIGSTDFRGSVESIPSQFALLFDRAFGDKHLTLRCFARSSMASMFAILLVTAVWVLALWPRDWLIVPADGAPFYVRISPSLGRALLSGQVWVILGIAVIVNLIPDYVSLLESRLILRRMSAGRGLAALLTLDMLLTAGPRLRRSLRLSVVC